MKSIALRIAGLFILVFFIVPSIVMPQVKIQKPFSNIKSGSYIANQKVTLACKDRKAKIYYTIDGSEPTQKSLTYTDQFTLNKSTVVKAVAVSKGAISDIFTLNFTKIENIKSVKFLNEPSPRYKLKSQYSYLADIPVSEDLNDGSWLAFEGKDFEAVITFENAVSISEVSFTMLQKTDAGIFYPKSVELYISPDEKSFFKSAIADENQFAGEKKLPVRTFTIPSRTAVTKALKIVMKEKDSLPEGNGKTWLFIRNISFK